MLTQVTSYLYDAFLNPESAAAIKFIRAPRHDRRTVKYAWEDIDSRSSPEFLEDIVSRMFAHTRVVYLNNRKIVPFKAVDPALGEDRTWPKFTGLFGRGGVTIQRYHFSEAFYDFIKRAFHICLLMLSQKGVITCFCFPIFSDGDHIWLIFFLANGGAWPNLSTYTTVILNALIYGTIYCQLGVFII